MSIAHSALLNFVAFLGILTGAACARGPLGGTDTQSPTASALEAKECERSSAPGYSNPEALVREYVERDGRGEFGSSKTNKWLIDAHYCPIGLPGWDVVTIVKAASLDSVVVAGFQGYGYVTYHRIGRSAGDGFTKALDLERVALRLVRLENGWWLNASQEPHFLVATALAWPALPDSIRSVVERLARN